jgi:adenosylhomocysteine nucleosidase
MRCALAATCYRGDVTHRSLLVVMALPIEAQGRFETAGVPVLFTGVGKVNAAHRLTRALADERVRGGAPLVLNFGTAGSRRFATGAVIACRRFVQRDMDVTGLGFPPHETPFEDVPRVLEFPEVFTDLLHGVCGSGDRFESARKEPDFDVVDMEAYALAKVCHFEGAPFACVKYVTDGADSSAASDWAANLPHAADAFLALYEKLAASP